MMSADFERAQLPEGLHLSERGQLVVVARERVNVFDFSSSELRKFAKLCRRAADAIERGEKIDGPRTIVLDVLSREDIGHA